MSKQILFLVLISIVNINLQASDTNTTSTNKVEIIVTLTGMKEAVKSIEKSSQQIVTLTQKLSNKKDFTKKDHELIVNLTKALNNNADAVNNIAVALPKQFEKVEGGVINIIDTTSKNVKDVISSSKDNLIDPTLESMENKILFLVFIVSSILFGLLWYGLWKIKTIANTGSETIKNVMGTVKSLENVLEKINKSEQ